MATGSIMPGKQILGFATFVTPAQTLAVVAEDEPENRILECAVEAGSDIIVSADNDLLRLGSYAGISIMKPDDFVKTREEPRTDAG